MINPHSDVNQTHEILQDETKCEFILVVDQQMTASARYADILLPDVSSFELWDLAALRNLNTARFQKLGSDTGFDAVADE